MAAGGEVGQQLCIPARAAAGLPGPARHPGAPPQQHLCQDDQAVVKDGRRRLVALCVSVSVASCMCCVAFLGTSRSPDRVNVCYLCQLYSCCSTCHHSVSYKVVCSLAASLF